MPRPYVNVARKSVLMSVISLERGEHSVCAFVEERYGSHLDANHWLIMTAALELANLLLCSKSYPCRSRAQRHCLNPTAQHEQNHGS